MNSDRGRHSDTGSSQRGDTSLSTHRDITDVPDKGSTNSNPVNSRLDDALEKVAHGATVSGPAILLQQGLTFAFTVILTNGFGAYSYGLFVLADQLQGYLVSLISGFKSGFNRFLPSASAAEQDVLVTFASLLLLSVATIFGTGLFIAAPLVTQVAGHGPQFQLFVRVFAVGLPASVWFQTVVAILRGLEEVGLYNLVTRVGLPTAHLIVGGLGTFVFHDLLLVIVGMLITTGLVGITATGWLASKRGFGLRIRRGASSQIRSQYIWFTVPLLVNAFATTTQRLGFYPLIVLFLSSVAGGVFAIGVLVGSFVRLPLLGINQFLPPVSAKLHDENNREALRRMYHVTSRLVLIGITGISIPFIVYRTTVMQLFGPTFVSYAPLLPGFIMGQYIACASGSVSVFLKMTDHQRELLVVNLVITAFLIVTAVPITILFGLPGLVASYFLMLVVNDGLQLAMLYHLERIQPFTRLHAKPLFAAVPLVVVTLAARTVFPETIAPLLGTLLGLATYAGVLYTLGFTQLEGRVAMSLVKRYRNTFRTSIVFSQ